MSTPSLTHSVFSGRIGVDRADITPPIAIYSRNWGAAKHDVASGVHRPLTLTTLTFVGSNDARPLVMIAADLGWWRAREDEFFLRGGVAQGLAIDPARIMLCLSHTHAGPSIAMGERDKAGGEHIEPYLRHVRDIAIETTQNALKSAEKSTLSLATGRCSLARNRDLPDPNQSRIVCGFNPEIAADDTLLVGRITRSSDDATLATLLNYACHPTTLAWDNHFISPDYVGAMREVVEGATRGAPCLFLQGASGELAPRTQYVGDTAIADANGRQLGYAALSALEEIAPDRADVEFTAVVESGAPLATWKRVTNVRANETLEAREADVEMELKRDLPTVAEIERDLAKNPDRVIGERLARKLRVRQFVGDRSTTKFPVYVWRLGDALFVGQGNEAYSLFQTALRERFPDRATIVMNIVNAGCGYLAPAGLYETDIYQVWQSPFARGSLERLIDVSATTIEQMLPK